MVREPPPPTAALADTARDLLARNEVSHRWIDLDTAPRYSDVMGSPDRRRRSRAGRLLDAVVWGTALGAAAGAALAKDSTASGSRHNPSSPR
jgi:hypothetical protein